MLLMLSVLDLAIVSNLAISPGVKLNFALVLSNGMPITLLKVYRRIISQNLTDCNVI
jgi:hypothetical protein